MKFQVIIVILDDALYQCIYKCKTKQIGRFT